MMLGDVVYKCEMKETTRTLGQFVVLCSGFEWFYGDSCCKSEQFPEKCCNINGRTNINASVANARGKARVENAFQRKRC